MRYSSVIFDLDGTLLNTLDDLANAGNYTLNLLKLPTHAVQQYTAFIGDGIPSLIEKMLPENERTPEMIEKGLNIFTTYYQQHMLDVTHPYEGIQEMLTKLLKENITLSVLSNKQDVFVKQITEQFFPNIFNQVSGLKKGFLPKPNPKSLLNIIHNTSISPAKTLYCGDSNVDIQTGNNAHIQTCGVLWGFQSKEQLQQAGATMLVNTPQELTHIILNNPL